MRRGRGSLSVLGALLFFWGALSSPAQEVRDVSELSEAVRILDEIRSGEYEAGDIALWKRIDKLRKLTSDTPFRLEREGSSWLSGVFYNPAIYKGGEVNGEKIEKAMALFSLYIEEAGRGYESLGPEERERIGKELAEILSRDEFQGEEESDFVRMLYAKIRKWLREFFWMGSDTGTGKYTVYLGWGIIAAAALWLLYRVYGRTRLSLLEKEAGRALPGGDDAEEGRRGKRREVDGRTVADFFLRKKKLRAGVRFLAKMVIEKLVERGAVPDDKSLTGKEIESLLGGSPGSPSSLEAPSLLEDFAVLNRSFYEIWYGGRDIQAAEFLDLRDIALSLSERISAPARQAEGEAGG